MRITASRTAVLATVAAALLPWAGATAHADTGADPAGRTAPAGTVCGTRNVNRQVVGGVRLLCLPLLGRGQDFDSTFDDARIDSRIWESRRGDGWGVDAVVDVVHHPGLRTPQAAASWMIRWQDRPAAESRYRRVWLAGRPAWLSADEITWLQAPGVAVSVRVDRARFATDLTRVVLATRG